VRDFYYVDKTEGLWYKPTTTQGDKMERWQKNLYMLLGVVVEKEVLPMADFARLVGKSRHGLNTRFHEGLLPGIQEPGKGGKGGPISIFVRVWAEGMKVKGTTV